MVIFRAVGRTLKNLNESARYLTVRRCDGFLSHRRLQ